MLINFGGRKRAAGSADGGDAGSRTAVGPGGMGTLETNDQVTSRAREEGRGAVRREVGLELTKEPKGYGNVFMTGCAESKPRLQPSLVEGARSAGTMTSCSGLCQGILACRYCLPPCKTPPIWDPGHRTGPAFKKGPAFRFTPGDGRPARRWLSIRQFLTSKLGTTLGNHIESPTHRP